MNLSFVACGFFQYSRKNTGSSFLWMAISPSSPGGSSLPWSSITATRCPGSGLHRPGGVAVAHHVIDLGLAEHFVDRHAELRLRPFDHRHADRFAGAHDASDIQ